jgi:hypothetical protein
VSTTRARRLHCMGPADATRPPTGGVTARVPYEDLAGALDRLTQLLATHDQVVLELTPPGAADVGTVSAVARLVLLGRRCGHRLQVRGNADLQRLAELTGLACVLGVEPGSAQPERQPEPGEDVVAEEVVDVRDPAR